MLRVAPIIINGMSGLALTTSSCTGTSCCLLDDSCFELLMVLSFFRNGNLSLIWFVYT